MSKFWMGAAAIGASQRRDSPSYIFSTFSLPFPWGDHSCFSPPSQPCLKYYINSRALTKELYCQSCSESAVCSRWLAAIHRLCFETTSAFPHSPPSHKAFVRHAYLKTGTWIMECWEQDLSILPDGPKRYMSLWPTVAYTPCSYWATSQVQVSECVSLRKGCCHLSLLSPLCPW